MTSVESCPKSDCETCCDDRFARKRSRNLIPCKSSCRFLEEKRVQENPLDVVGNNEEETSSIEICKKSGDYLICRQCCKQFLHDKQMNYGCVRQCSKFVPSTTSRTTTTTSRQVVAHSRNRFLILFYSGKILSHSRVFMYFV